MELGEVGAIVDIQAMGLCPDLDEARSREVARFPMLRQQAVAPDGKPNRCLADFVASRTAPLAAL